MAGQIKKLIDNVVQTRSKGNVALATITRAKLALKGINPDKYTDNSPDDPAILTRLQSLADELSVRPVASNDPSAPAFKPSANTNLESRMSELRHKYGQRDYPAERWASRFSDAPGTAFPRNSPIEEENRRLRNAVADLQIEIQTLKEMLGRRF